MEVDNGDDAINLTMEDDETQTNDEVNTKRDGKKASKNKKKKKKRAAESAKAHRSGEIEVTSKPSKKMDDIPRPAKRSKISASGEGWGGNEDVEIMGTTGSSKLPHTRFSCPENAFTHADKAGHKERCDLCFCYVCDRPATDCDEWADHCHATTSGPNASTWKALRARARPLILAGKRPPVSGLNQGSVVPSTATSSVSGSSSAPGPAADTGGADEGGPQAPPPAEFSCNCPEICIPVRTVIASCGANGCSIPPSKPVVYLAGLTAEQAKHTEDIAVGEALSLFARQLAYRLHRGKDTTTQVLKEQAYKERNKPRIRKTQTDGGKIDMAIASRVNRKNSSLPTPWASKWTPGSSKPRSVRLGVVRDIGFTITTPEPLSLDKRKAHFETFVSRTPLPVTIWEDVLQKHGAAKLEQPVDTKLLQVLKDAHKEFLIEVEIRAECDPSFIQGSLTIEVILLTKLLSRGRSLEERVAKGYNAMKSYKGLDAVKNHRLVDFVPVVERLVLNTAVHQNAEADSAPSASSPGSSSASYLSPSPSLPRTPSSSISPSSYGSPPALALTPSSSIPPSPSGANAFIIKNKGKQKKGAGTTAPTATPAGGKRRTIELSSDDEEEEEEDHFLPQPATPTAPTSQPFANTLGATSNFGDGESSGSVGGGADAGEVGVGVMAGAGAVVGGSGQKFRPSKPVKEGCGGRASTDVTLEGLIESVRAEEKNPRISSKLVRNPTELLKVLENVQHGALIKQPDCLTVQLFEHQLQATQWMYDQEVLEGGAMQHVWAELPPHPQMPANDDRSCEFRRCWYSPALNQFTVKDPFKAGTKGGLLCDEMGLGKTAATLALHLIHPPQTPSPGVPLDEEEWGPITGAQATPMVAPKSTSGAKKAPGKVVSKGTLVVCKVSLVGQWVEEAKRLCGGALSIYPYHGSHRKKDPAFLAEFDIVVTTYGIVQSDATRNKGYPPLRKIRWWRVVLDESHTLSHGSGSSNAVRELVANRRWCMTGTPFTSGFSDVNRQLAFVGVAGAFRDRDLGDKRPNTDTQAEVTAVLRRVVLRHSQGMKLGANSLLGLPTITHKVEVLTLPPKELEAYHDFENTIQSQYRAVRWKLLNVRGSHAMAVLTLLSKFRQACSGGQLLLHEPAKAKLEEGALGNDAEFDTDGEDVGGSERNGWVKKKTKTAGSMDAFCSVCHELFDSPVKTECGHAFCQACIAGALAQGDDDDEGPCPKCKKTVTLGDLTPIGGGCGFGLAAGGSGSDNGPGVMMETKLKALVEKLAAIQTNDPTSKSLVFSQYNSSLDWLKHALPKRGFQFRTLTGNMTRKQRTDSLQAFANDPPTTVFLLSVRAGAVGINLTQANNVFLLEPMLNLALEKQAIGRVHRLGQTRPVTVTKLVLADSVETRILAMQKKQASGGGTAGSSLSKAQGGPAGSLAREDARHLKVEEYDEFFGVNRDKPSSNVDTGKSV